jgi:6-phosphogluconolactonase (cycloisomerase 2 family)
MTEQIKLLIGTYTEESNSKGVYLYSFNEKTGESKELDTEMSGNPSFVLLSEDNQYFYSVNEYNTGKQGVSSYSIKDNKITKLNELSCDFNGKSGADPCNLLLHKNLLISSNYTGGSFTVFDIDESSKQLKKSIQYFSYSDKSHIHCAILTPDKKYIFFTDLGADKIHRFTISENKETPLIDHKIVYEYKNKTQAGPRHMIFSKDGNFFYVICELDDLLSIFNYKDGEINHIETIKAYDGEGKGSADIHFSNNGNFLYTSHRLKKDGISIFKVDKNKGTVEKIGYQETGIHPRNFGITPNGKYLLCACRDSNIIQIYEIDQDKGFLTNIHKDIVIDKPVCVKFLY